MKKIGQIINITLKYLRKFLNLQFIFYFFIGTNLPRERERGGYRIEWESKLTGKTGHGEYLEDRELAMAWIEQAQKYHPDLIHTLTYKGKEKEGEPLSEESRKIIDEINESMENILK